MGTRNVTEVKDENGRILVAMYCQYGGYPEGHGKELLAFLDGMQLVNGLVRNDSERKVANGMDCLAAQIVAHFKDGPGDFYLIPPMFNGGDTPYGAWEEYIYTVFPEDGEIKVTVTNVNSNATYDLDLAVLDNT